MKTSSLLIGLFMLLFLSCNNSNKRVSYAIKNTDLVKDTIHPGKKLMETYCYTCHNANTSEANRLAPPMIAIKKHYIFQTTSKEDFINDMQHWIKNPNEKDAKMFGAVRRFGVMQNLPFPDEAIRQIADYIYDYNIEEPQWFQEHYNQKGRNSIEVN